MVINLFLLFYSRASSSRYYRAAMTSDTNAKRANFLCQIVLAVLRYVSRPVPGFTLPLTDEQTLFATELAAACQTNRVDVSYIHRLAYSLFTETLRDVDRLSFSCAFEAVHLLLCLQRSGNSFCPVATLSPLNGHLEWIFRAVVLREAYNCRASYDGGIGSALAEKYARYVRQNTPYAFNYLRGVEMQVTRLVLTTPPEPDVFYCELQNTITVFRPTGNELILLSTIENQGSLILRDCEERFRKCCFGVDISDVESFVDGALDGTRNDCVIEDIVRKNDVGYSFLRSDGLLAWRFFLLERLCVTSGPGELFLCDASGRRHLNVCRLSSLYVLAGEFVDVSSLSFLSLFCLY